MSTITMKIEGMTCGGCVASVTRVLKATPGVSDAKVTLQPAEAQVTYDPQKTDVTQLTAAVEEAGYDVAG
jgi:copper chaperone